MTQQQTMVDDFHLLIVSNNRLSSEATGAALREEEAITSYELARIGGEHSHLRKTDLEPHVVIFDACCFDDLAELFDSIVRLTEELPESHFVVLAYDASTLR